MMSSIDGLMELGIKSNLLDFIVNTVPFAKVGFGWVIPACICMIIANFIPSNHEIIPRKEMEANIA